MSASRSHRRWPNRGPGRFRSSFSASMAASVAAVALTLLLVCADLAGSVAARPLIEPTPTEQPSLDGPFRPIEIATEVPTRDVPGLGVPTETPPTEEVIPTEVVVPTDEVIPTEPLEIIPTETFEGADRHDTSVIQINKFICPDGTSYGMALGDYVSECTTSGAGFEFSVTDGIGTTSTVTDANGYTEFTEVIVPQEGEVQIQETLVDGYDAPVVFCGEPTSEAVLVPSDGGFVIPQPASNPFIYRCSWYNIPVDEPGDGTVAVRKYYCPAGVESGLTLDEYIDDCTDPMQDTTFTLVDGFGAHEQTTNPDAGGVVWENVVIGQEGELQIQEDIPVEYLDPVVFCGMEESAPVLMPSANGFVIPQPSAVPFYYLCHWFNIPAERPDGNTIDVQKRYCPEGTAYGLSLDDYDVACNTALLETTFTLVDGNGQHPQGIDGNGIVSWDGVTIGQEGELQLTETIPDGFGDPVVFCGDKDGELNLMDSANGFVTPILAIPTSTDEPFHYWCAWYNIPDDDPGNEIDLFKYYCPEGTATDLTMEEYQTLCIASKLDTTFTLVDGAGMHEQTTDSNGYVGWDGVVIGQEGELQLIEEIPDGYGDPVVFCGEPDSVLDLMPSANGFVVPIPGTADPFSYVCHWFNIPDDGGNAVELWKHYCPAGTSDALTIADYMAICNEPVPPTTFTLTDPDGSYPMTTDANGYTRWLNVSTTAGQVAIAEELLPGYGTPQVFCEYSGQQPEQVPATNGYLHLSLVSDEFTILCQVFNIPNGDPENWIEIQKYFCPLGTSDALTLAEYVAACVEPVQPTTFTLTDPDGSYPKTTDQNGYANWKNVSTTAGQVAIAEKLPAGYGTPQVFCQNIHENPVQIPATNGYMHLTLPSDESFILSCWVFNIPTDDTSSLTIVKNTCPEGYDLYAPGANPGNDCQMLTDGIPFVLDDGMPGIDPGGTTGDSGPGIVTFADVKPGSYTVEEIVPPGMGDPFVLDCEGDVPQLQPYPLWSGNDLPITLNPGDTVWCFWYNVPEPDPDLGTLTVTKHICTTETFISDVDCQIYEDGWTFDLLSWDSVQWNVIDTATTDAFGRIVWTDLPIGHYRVEEHNGPWCHFTSSALLGNDNSFNINHQGGMDQTVDVYNCGADPKTPNDTPKDYPNTGIGAGQSDSSTRLAAREDRLVPPADTLDSATPAAPQCLPADDPAATSGDAACPRGAVPASIRIDAIGVDAPIEVKETVGGQMQQPSNETEVAWYKESARLGETGNMLFAGHLNWWGIPQAVFYSLGDLQEGDEIVLTDASGATWTYRVTWVRQEDSLAPASADVLGPTADPSITLITCGGEWNAEAGLYDERTVVRAVLVSGPATE
ncbi:MAG: sortase [Thermomicrobiales bacterium]